MFQFDKKGDYTGAFISNKTSKINSVCNRSAQSINYLNGLPDSCGLFGKTSPSNDTLFGVVPQSDSLSPIQIKGKRNQAKAIMF